MYGYLPVMGELYIEPVEPNEAAHAIRINVDPDSHWWLLECLRMDETLLVLKGRTVLRAKVDARRIMVEDRTEE